MLDIISASHTDDNTDFEECAPDWRDSIESRLSVSLTKVSDIKSVLEAIADAAEDATPFSRDEAKDEATWRASGKLAGLIRAAICLMSSLEEEMEGIEGAGWGEASHTAKAR